MSPSVRRMGILMRADFAEYRRRPLFWIWGAVLLVISWLYGRGALAISAGDGSAGVTKAWVTSEFATAHFFGIGTLLAHGFFVAIACGMPLVREERARIGDMLATTPLRRHEHVWAKYGAAVLACLLLLALHTVLVMACNHLGPAPASGIRGPFSVSQYAIPISVLALPTVVFLSGVAFALGSWSGRALAVFVLPVALLLLCNFVLWEWYPSNLGPGVRAWLMVLDPTGFRWLEQTYLDVDRGAAFYNGARVVWGADFLASRMAWSALGLAAVAWVARRPRAPRREKARTEETAAVAPSKMALREMRQVRRPVAWMLGRLVRTELSALVRQAGLYLFVPVILIAIVPGVLDATGPFESNLLPTPGMLARKCGPGLLLGTAAMLFFYTVESMGRDARTRIADIVSTTPVSAGTRMLGAVLANLVLGALILAVAWLVCLLVLVVRGAPSLAMGPFVLSWFVLGMPTLAFFCAFATMVYGRTRSRSITYVAGVLLLAATAWLGVKGYMTWTTNWLLWKSVPWSDISVLEWDRTVLILNRLFVVSLTLLFLRVAVGLRGRFYLAPYWAPALGLGLAVWACVASGYQGDATKRADKDYWKQNVATYRDVPLPDMTFVDLDIELTPATSSMRVRGTYELENHTEAPIRRIPLTTAWHMHDLEFTLNGAPYAPENRSNLRIFTPDAPLMPQATAKIGFSYTARVPDGASANGGRVHQFILPSSVVLSNLDATFVPALGFRDDIGITDDNRAEARVYEPDFYAGTTKAAMPGANRPFRTRIRVTTPEDFMANSVGTKTAESTAGGKRMAIWESDEPLYYFNIVGGRWKVEHAGDTEVYYSPEHATNVAEVALALQSAKKYYSEWFYPYPWQSLKLSEFAGLDGYAEGFSTNISFSESIGFLAEPGGRDPLPFWITAHEVAHQWWPGLVMFGDGPGANVLAEGLSHFSAMLLLEAVKGKEARIAFADRIERHYARTRRADSEQPLVRSDTVEGRQGLAAVWYARGGWAFWMLMNTTGREEFLRGLHAFVAKYRGHADHPALHDLFETMRPFAKDAGAFDAFVAEWFEAVTLPRFRVASVQCKGAGARWRVHGTLENVGTGRVLVDVAVTSAQGSARVQVHATPDAPAEFEIDTDFPPERIVVDPDRMVLQLERQAAAAACTT
ncbi:hypothetical protein LVJ94_46625 [Pendulispora rubella]|uniref:Peptidase M1 membrane alanine aminopeptidase domain-containing protein n=1 Tax=Pendulispora rubella TaxID=2741070 RepID=A0ABZ2L3I8_9BACT